MAKLEVTSMKKHWDRLSGLPGGKALFSKALGIMAPYTGTIDPTILDLRPGLARVALNDRRKVRNHLSSIHAVALVNLAELAGNLAVIASLPESARMIVTGLSMEYLKKARGRITATAEAPTSFTEERQQVETQIRLEDPSGQLVARARVQCLVGPRKA